MKRLEVLKQLVETSEGQRILDGVVVTLASSTRSIDRAAVTSRDRVIADLAEAYVGMVSDAVAIRDIASEADLADVEGN